MSKHNTAGLHIGAGRYYDCPKHRKATPNGPLEVGGACTIRFLEDGELIPICQVHGIMLKKRKWRTPQELFQHLLWQKQLVFNFGYEVMILKDAAVRRSICVLCQEVIRRGDPRVGIDWNIGRRTTPDGGFYSRRRRYMHRTCLIDAIFDGNPGEGCPGCTAKIADREFREYKKYVKERLRGQQ